MNGRFPALDDHYDAKRTELGRAGQGLSAEQRERLEGFFAAVKAEPEEEDGPNAETRAKVIELVKAALRES